MTRSLKHARFLAGALALVLGLTLVAPPAHAEGPATIAPPRPLAVAANARVAALPATVLAQAAPAAQTAPAADTGKSFFRTTKGAVALVLIVGAIGYAGYSLHHDRIKSPAK